MLDAPLRERLAAAAWWGLVVFALLGLLVLLRTVRAGNRWIARTTSLALGASSGVALSYLTAPPAEPLLHFAWITALCSLAASILLAGERLGGAGKRPQPLFRPGSLPYVIGVIGLFAGTVSAVAMLVPLALRVLEFLSELLTLRPWSGVLVGYGINGAWTLGVLVVSGVLATWSSRDSRPLPALAASSLALVTWLALLQPVLALESRDSVRWTGRSVLLACAVAAVLCGIGALLCVWRRRADRREVSEDPVTSPAPDASGGTVDRLVWRVIRTLVTGSGVALLLLVWYHLIAPLDSVSLGQHEHYALLAVAAFVGAAGAWAATERIAWSGSADVAFALLTTGTVCVGLACLPTFPAGMAERYPPVFNVLLAGFSLAAWGWTWLAERGHRGGSSTPPPGPDPWSGPARRFAFVCVLLALASGGMMSFWPRLRSIATADFSLGRVTAGFGGHLLLLLVTLWMARRVRTPAFVLLVPLALLASAGFLLMRMLPYTPRFG